MAIANNILHNTTQSLASLGMVNQVAMRFPHFPIITDISRRQMNEAQGANDDGDQEEALV